MERKVASYRFDCIDFPGEEPRQRGANKPETKYLDFWASDRKTVSFEDALRE